VALSIGGAIIGGIIWYVIAVTTGYWVGYVALLVGILAGLGMQMGQKGYSSLGGISAAAIAAVAIILSSVAVVMGDVSDTDSSDYDHRVVEMLTNENLRAKNIDPENADYEQYDAAEEAALKKLEKTNETEMKALVAKADEVEAKEELETYVAYDTLKRMNINPDDANETQRAMARKQARQRIDPMTPAQREAEKKRVMAAHPEVAAHVQENSEAGDGDADEDEEGSSAGETAVFIVILFLVFGWKSLIFLLLAVSIAYKTAAGAVSD
jgi:hypothetical protein